LANFVNKSQKGVKLLRCLFSFVFLSKGGQIREILSFFTQINTEKFSSVFQMTSKKPKKLQKGLFFPQRANLSAGLAGKFYQELTALPLRAIAVHSGTADTACLVVRCFASERKSTSLFPPKY
jgi:hypothetical protein